MSHLLAADFARESACLLFERADGELGAGVTVAEILLNPLLEPAAALALRDVDKVVQNQFAVAPGIGADNEDVPETDATGIVRDYPGAPSGLRQLFMVRHRNTIDD